MSMQRAGGAVTLPYSPPTPTTHRTVQLDDVAKVSPAAGDVLVWDAVRHLYVPGGLTLDSLSDVVIGGAIVGDVIQWSGTAWVNGDAAIVICTSSTRPATPNEGQVIYETDTDRIWVYDGAAWILHAGKLPRFLGRMPGTQSIPVTTVAAVQLNSELYDTDNGHNNAVNNHLYTIPTGLGGMWRCSYSCDLSGGASVTGGREFWISINGTGTSPRWAEANTPGAAGVRSACAGSVDILLAAGDTVELDVFQSSATAQTAGSQVWCYLQCVYTGPS